MKLKKVKKPTLIPVEKEEVKEKPKKKGNKLPPDTYKTEFDPFRIFVDEYSELNIEVKRGGADGLPRLDLRHYQTTDYYTGFTQKGINIPIELLDDLIEVLEFVKEECERRELL